MPLQERSRTMARRGFFAELQHQAKLAAREQERANKAAERDYKAAVRQAEQARRADERAAKQLERADAAERKRLEKEASAAHVAYMEAEAESRNVKLAEIYSDIDSLLAATLDVDDYVDLEAFKTVVEHPPFHRPDLEVASPSPTPIPDPKEPELNLPAKPTGLAGLFGKKKHESSLARTKQSHKKGLLLWKRECEKVDAQRQVAHEEREQQERARKDDLVREREVYSKKCAKREAVIAEQNQKTDQLISDLGYGTVEAVQEYVSIVLANSLYPESFPVEHDFSFDAASAELSLRVLVPGPDKVPSVKAHKYTKSKDEITASALSQKACKDRYLDAVQQVSLRSLHEVFEADRRGIIKTITLEVGTETLDPATGQEVYLPFVATGAERESFMAINLSKVVPSATLTHLGASVSKNPHGLVPVATKGVRKS